MFIFSLMIRQAHHKRKKNQKIQEQTMLQRALSKSGKFYQSDQSLTIKTQAPLMNFLRFIHSQPTRARRLFLPAHFLVSASI